MLIIPVEKNIDWRRPPLATIGLILVNLMIFVSFLHQDDRLQAEALKQYVSQDLPALEIPAYEVYLERQFRLHGRSDGQLLLAIKNMATDEKPEWLYPLVLRDLDFAAYLVRDGSYFWHEAVYNNWRKSRQEIYDRYLNQMSDIKYGLLTADLNLSDFVTYQFLHAGWWHLIGNMLFLFVFGFTIERALGAIRFVIAYLLCGMFSAEFYALFAGEDLVPLVGASGSISGLMGMYVALFGRQRIRFFYNIAIYFGYFTAPALAVLPVWLGKEIIEYSFGRHSNIAFMAHVGGMLAGAGLIALFGKSWLQVKAEFHEASDDDKDEAFREEYDLALKALGRMEFPVARERFRVLYSKYPQAYEILLHTYHLEKLKPQSEAFAKVLSELVDALIRRGDFAALISVYRESVELTKHRQVLNTAVITKVLYACIREGDLKEAERVFTHLREREKTEAVREACLLLINAFKQRQQQLKVNQYQDAVRAHRPGNLGLPPAQPSNTSSIPCLTTELPPRWHVLLRTRHWSMTL
jgi:membrane associated rhomboid family serine protease